MFSWLRTQEGSESQLGTAPDRTRTARTTPSQTTQGVGVEENHLSQLHV